MTTRELVLADVQLESLHVRDVNPVVAQAYALQMGGGDVFPPIVVAEDDGRLYLIDGGHRIDAARAIGRTTFPADVHAVPRTEALWMALGANRANAHRMDGAATKHAVQVALQNFPDKSASIIAAQIGCTKQYVAEIRNEVSSALHLPDRVTGVDGRSYAATSESKRVAREQAVQMIREGHDLETVKAETGLGRDSLIAARHQAGTILDKTKAGVAARRARMRAMAADGHTSIQIAGAVGMSVEGCRGQLRALGIHVHADSVTRNLKRHDSNRIVDTMVVDATNLTEGVALIDFAGLDRERIPEWLASLQVAREQLSGLIRRLMKERQHGEAAQPAHQSAEVA